MRIVLVVPGFPKLSETFIVNKVLRLLAAGHDAKVICDRSEATEWAQISLEDDRRLRSRVIQTSPRRPLWRAALSAPVVLIRCLMRNPQGTFRYLRRSWPSMRWRTLIRLYLDAELVGVKPEIVHFEFGALAVDRMHLGEILACKIVVSFRGHDLNFVGLDQPDYYSEVWKKADAVHLLGRDLWARARERGCPPGIKRALIAPAIDLRRFDRATPPARETIGTNSRPARLLSVGRLYWTKGHEYVMSSVKLLIDRGLSVHLRIVGEGDFLDAASFCRQQLGLEDVVTLVGAAPPAHVVGELVDADIFVLGSVSEGFGNSVIEAQAMGLPVVVSDAGGLPENVADGVTGFIAHRRDPVAMAEKLAFLIDDPDLRQKMGQAGRKRVETLFRLEDQIRAFESLYDEVCREAPEGEVSASSERAY